MAFRHEVYNVTDESLREALVRPVSSYSFLHAIEQARKAYKRVSDQGKRLERVESSGTKASGSRKGDKKGQVPAPTPVCEPMRNECMKYTWPRAGIAEQTVDGTLHHITASHHFIAHMFFIMQRAF